MQGNPLTFQIVGHQSETNKEGVGWTARQEKQIKGILRGLGVKKGRKSTTQTKVVLYCSKYRSPPTYRSILKFQL